MDLLLDRVLVVVTDILDELGIEIIRDTGNEINALCPGHKMKKGREDSNPSWYINSESGAHICFSCGFKGNLTYLVAFMKDMTTESGFFDFDAAKMWLDRYVGFSLESALTNLNEDMRIVPHKAPYLKESSMALFVPLPEDVLKARKISAESAHFYGVRWDPSRDIIVCPLRDRTTSNLIGWQEKTFPKKGFKWYPSGVQLNRHMFGSDRYTGGPMILVESPLDCLRLFTAGVHTGVATCGSEITTGHVEALRHADSVVVAMDNDQAGKKASISVLEQAIAKRFDVSFFNYTTDHKDVGEMDNDSIHTGIATARHSILGKRAVCV